MIHKKKKDQGSQVSYFKKKEKNHGGFKKPHSLDIQIFFHCIPSRVFV